LVVVPSDGVSNTVPSDGVSNAVPSIR
jgi:hypothetical protein